MQQSTQRIVWLSILSALVLSIFAFDLFRGSGASTSFTIPSDIARPIVYAESPRKGDGSITVFVFEDFACPACKALSPALARLAREHANTIQIVWKDFPVHGTDKALAARCAGEQDMFWQYHDWLFAQQNNTTFNYEEGAVLFSLSMPDFQSCQNKQSITTLVERDFAEGRALGIDEAPTIVIGDIAFTGVVAYDELERAVLHELAVQKK